MYIQFILYESFLNLHYNIKILVELKYITKMQFTNVAVFRNYGKRHVAREVFGKFVRERFGILEFNFSLV